MENRDFSIQQPPPLTVLNIQHYRVTIGILYNKQNMTSVRRDKSQHHLPSPLSGPTLLITILSSASFTVQSGTPMATLKLAMLERAKSPLTLGFESGDELLDYRLQHGLGKVEKDLTFKVLQRPSGVVLNGLEKYKRFRCIAIGGFSKVYIVRSLLDGNFYAAKFIDKSKFCDPERAKLVHNQKNINQSLDSPFIAKMHDFIETEHFFVFVMEYCPGGQIFFLLRQVHRMTQETARPYFVEVLLGLEYMHSQQIIYRDLKPQNILLDASGHVRIADFGLAKRCRGRTHSYCGSVEYMSPEIINSEGHSFAVDYYCLGALLYELLIGCPPFYNPDLTEKQTKQRILSEEVRFPEKPALSQQVKHLIQGLLQKNQEARLGYLGGIREIRCHPWIGRIDKVAISQMKGKMPYERDLNVLNFDSEEIGDSQNRFTRKIDDEYLLLRENISRKQPKKYFQSKQYHQSPYFHKKPKRPPSKERKSQQKNLNFLRYSLDQRSKINHLRNTTYDLEKKSLSVLRSQKTLLKCSKTRTEKDEQFDGKLGDYLKYLKMSQNLKGSKQNILKPSLKKKGKVLKWQNQPNNRLN